MNLIEITKNKVILINSNTKLRKKNKTFMNIIKMKIITIKIHKI